MDTIYRGDLATPGGRRNAWLDSLLVDHALLRLGWSNFGVVAPGRLYRSNHPTPGRVAAMARRLGLRTLINLRGACGNGSDALAREAAARHGLAFVDAPFRSREAPRKDAVLNLLGLFATVEMPALLYCKSGADRTGFAAGLFALAEGAPVAIAQTHLSSRHGHLSRSRAGVLGAFFRLYGASGQGTDLARWVRDTYDPAVAAALAATGQTRTARFVHDTVLMRE